MTPPGFDPLRTSRLPWAVYDDKAPHTPGADGKVRGYGRVVERFATRDEAEAWINDQPADQRARYSFDGPAEPAPARRRKDTP